jgi:hypothetical protein
VSSETSAFVRPAPPHTADEGMKWTVIQENEREWRPADPDKDCRWRGSGAGHACGAPATVQVLRGIRRQIWWRYCASHALSAYGRWAEDGKVCRYQLADDPDWRPPS